MIELVNDDVKEIRRHIDTDIRSLFEAGNITEEEVKISVAKILPSENSS